MYFYYRLQGKGVLMDKKTFILDQLKKHAENRIVSFHVPGHKNGRPLEKYNSFSSDMMALDTTELPDTDNLHAPKGIIKKAQDRAAKVFRADHTFFLINGTSSGNISALMAVLNPGDKVIVPRDCHKSIMHGLIIGGYIPVYVNPQINTEWGIPAGIKPETIEKALWDNSDVKAVVITYPNYYGICSDIKAIANIVHKYSKILIVDEAHGSHFILNDRLPKLSIEAGADIVVQSTHKTLPALTQSSMLHVKSDKVDIDRLKTMLMMNQSSSPSYLLMASLDAATDIVDRDGPKLMGNLLAKITSFESEIKKIKGIKIMDEKIVGQDGVKDKDKTRLVINMTGIGFSGIELNEILRTTYNIQMEMADINNVVGVTTIGNELHDFEKLLSALKDIASNGVQKRIESVVPSFSFRSPKILVYPREATFSPKKNMLFKNSLGKISGEYIIPYPPGIPILCPGEEITKEIIEYVDHLKRFGVEIIGTKDEQLETIRVI